MIENGGPVLGAYIIALAVERGRIVNREKDIENLAVGRYVGIERNPNRFRMARPARAYFLVGGVRTLAAHVAGLDGLYSFQFVEDSFQTPKTAAGQGRDFATHSFMVSRSGGIVAR